MSSPTKASAFSASVSSRRTFNAITDEARYHLDTRGTRSGRYASGLLRQAMVAVDQSAVECVHPPARLSPRHIGLFAGRIARYNPRGHKIYESGILRGHCAPAAAGGCCRAQKVLSRPTVVDLEAATAR